MTTNQLDLTGGLIITHIVKYIQISWKNMQIFSAYFNARILLKI